MAKPTKEALRAYALEEWRALRGGLLLCKAYPDVAGPEGLREKRRQLRHWQQVLIDIKTDTLN